VRDGEVPVRLSLTPGQHREIRLGVGYSTEDGIRGLASWWSYNFFGGGRQLGISARASQINRSVSVSFLQPYFPAPTMRSSLTFNLGQDDESTYLDDFARLTPRIDWRVNNDIRATVFINGQYDSLSGVTDQTKQDLGVFQSSGFTVAPGLGLYWTALDDPVNPTFGLALGGSAEVAGGPFGADFDWYRLIFDGRAYHPVYGDLIFATRMTAGTIVPYDDTPQIPLWDRFYAGGSGINPVRGYGRRRVGPISGSDDPLGGRTVVVGSVELRYPLWGPLIGVLFVDAGDVELSSWQFQPENIQTGVGFGLRALSPVGPVELDIGFGLDRHPGDSLVQVNFSIGPNF
jgi:outer membrane translocation and assembly module TamA